MTQYESIKLIDERGRLDVMDKFAQDAIDFTAAITAALAQRLLKAL